MKIIISISDNRKREENIGGINGKRNINNGSNNEIMKISMA
jgi:hypothetical protein